MNVEDSLLKTRAQQSTVASKILREHFRKNLLR
jgi:hypothetical protein